MRAAWSSILPLVLGYLAASVQATTDVDVDAEVAAMQAMEAAAVRAENAVDATQAENFYATQAANGEAFEDADAPNADNAMEAEQAAQAEAFTLISPAGGETVFLPADKKLRVQVAIDQVALLQSVPEDEVMLVLYRSRRFMRWMRPETIAQKSFTLAELHEVADENAVAAIDLLVEKNIVEGAKYFVKLVGAKDFTWTTGEVFAMYSVGVPTGPLADRFKVVADVAVGNGVMKVMPSAVYNGRTVRYNVFEVQPAGQKARRISHGKFAMLQRDLPTDVNIDQSKMTADGQYFVELYLRPKMRMLLKRVIYRTGGFTQAQLMAEDVEEEPEQELKGGADSAEAYLAGVGMTGEQEQSEADQTEQEPEAGSAEAYLAGQLANAEPVESTGEQAEEQPKADQADEDYGLSRLFEPKAPLGPWGRLRQYARIASSMRGDRNALVE